MLADWRGWLIIAVLFATTYVQTVGKHVELMSGLDRLEHLPIYRSLFGGPPWVPWIMFRWGGIIQVAAIIAVWLVFGWKAAALTVVAWLIELALVWRIARGHAVEIFRDVQKRTQDREDSTLAHLAAIQQAAEELSHLP